MTSERFINGALLNFNVALFSWLRCHICFSQTALSGMWWNCEGILSGNKFRSKYTRNIRSRLITEYVPPFSKAIAACLKKWTQLSCHHETVKRETAKQERQRARLDSIYFALLRHLPRRAISRNLTRHTSKRERSLFSRHAKSTMPSVSSSIGTDNTSFPSLCGSRG